MPYGQRYLLLVPVPFSDPSSRTIRPVVVLSNDRYNLDGPDLLVAGITSNPLTRPFIVPLDTPQMEEFVGWALPTILVSPSQSSAGDAHPTISAGPTHRAAMGGGIPTYVGNRSPNTHAPRWALPPNADTVRAGGGPCQ